jgi:asparagine synthetase B (glutamine-hydrolysing)
VFESTMPADDLRLTALQLQRMIRHRGPDGSGVHLTESAVPGRRHVVAHERLAINGGVGGNQPLYSHDGFAALSINGEIYNHVVLREQLADSRPFATGSDCEVRAEDERCGDAAGPLRPSRRATVRQETGRQADARRRHPLSIRRPA